MSYANSAYTFLKQELIHNCIEEALSNTPNFVKAKHNRYNKWSYGLKGL